MEKALGLDLPTRDEMEEIELSARLYQEDGAEFMTMTALAGSMATIRSRPRSPSS